MSLHETERSILAFCNKSSQNRNAKDIFRTFSKVRTKPGSCWEAAHRRILETISNWTDGVVTTISAIFLSLVLVLFVTSVIRVLRTPRSDPLRGERYDLAVLVLVILLGVCGVSARDRFQVNSHQYWMANGLLIPLSMMSIWYVTRLIRTYRGETFHVAKSSPHIHKPPKLDPPADGQGRR